MYAARVTFPDAPTFLAVVREDAGVFRLFFDEQDRPWSKKITNDRSSVQRLYYVSDDIVNGCFEDHSIALLESAVSQRNRQLVTRSVEIDGVSVPLAWDVTMTNNEIRRLPPRFLAYLVSPLTYEASLSCESDLTRYFSLNERKFHSGIITRLFDAFRGEFGVITKKIIVILVGCKKRESLFRLMDASLLELTLRPVKWGYIFQE